MTYRLNKARGVVVRREITQIISANVRSLTGQRVRAQHLLQLCVQIRKIGSNDVRRPGHRILHDERRRLRGYRDHRKGLSGKQVVRDHTRDVGHHGIGVIDAVQDAAVFFCRGAPQMRPAGLSPVRVQQRVDPLDHRRILAEVIAERMRPEDHRRSTCQQG